MKRAIVLLCVGVIVSSLNLMAADSNVYSHNIAAIIPKAVPPGGLVLVSMGARNMGGGGTNTLLSIFDSAQLTSNLNYLACDRISLWENDQQRYHNYAQYAGVFYGCNNGAEWSAGVPTNPVVPLGSSFWIRRASGAVTTNTITLGGDAILDVTNQVPITTGLQMVSFPFSTDLYLPSMNTNGMTAAANYNAADQIMTWETNMYQRYALYTDGIWYKCNSSAEWAAGYTNNRTLGVGEGFWFRSRTNFTWTETNRYQR